MLFVAYQNIQKTMMDNLKTNGIECRSKASSGLWLGSLIGLSGILTLLNDRNSYSEICLVIGLTGFGLLVSCLSLYVRLSIRNNAIKDYHVIYFLPAIVTSMLYLFMANKGLLTSVLWGLCVGSMGTWGVLQLMSNCPGCFTIGEGIVVTHGFILFLLSVATNLPLRYHLPPIHDDDIVTVILQIGILYVLSISILCKNIFIRFPQSFYGIVLGTFFLFTVPLLYVFLDQDPLSWILFYILKKRHRIVLIIYWSICLLSSILIIIFQVLSDTPASTSNRKYFHIVAVLVYLPGLLYDPTLLYLGSGVMAGIFLLLEFTRILKISSLGNMLQSGFIIFADEKDHFLSLTPLYLLFGLSFPLWLPASNASLLILLSGVLTVGIGDTAASYFGSKWGKHKLRPGLTKSLEGMFGCFFSQSLMIFILVIMRYIENQWILRSISSVFIISYIESNTDQIDNLALPLLMYICLIV